jgi:hypothetical protein
MIEVKVAWVSRRVRYISLGPTADATEGQNA